MSDNLFTGVVSIAMAIVGVAIIAVLVAPNAKTSQVIGAAGNAFSQALGAATGPVSGGFAAGGAGIGRFY